MTTEESFLGRHAFRNSADVCPPEGVTDPNERNNVANETATIERPPASAIGVSQMTEFWNKPPEEKDTLS